MQYEKASSEDEFELAVGVLYSDGLRDIGVNIANHLYLRLGVIIASG